MKIYAIPDVHGRLDLLKKAYFAIFNDFGNSDDTNIKIVTLGDYIDRGPDSRGVIEFLMQKQEEHPSLVCLAGNHDRWMMDLYMDGLTSHYDAGEWLNCGGDTTLKSYGTKARLSRYGEDVPRLLRKFVPREHIDWIRGLPLYHETEDHVFVHAALDEAKDLHEQTEMVLMWALWPQGHPGGYREKTVVHGHEGIPSGPKVYRRRVNLDARAYKTGRLVVGIFNGLSVEFMEIT